MNLYFLNIIYNEIDRVLDKNFTKSDIMGGSRSILSIIAKKLKLDSAIIAAFL
ncbi:MAG: hypothetical protein RSE41_09895 [Clostridia bacterium]